jgi:hypothetical protein
MIALLAAAPFFTEATVFFASRYNARCRSIDVKILWPSVLRVAEGDVERARAAFLYHAFREPAWVGWLSTKEIEDTVKGLK